MQTCAIKSNLEKKIKYFDGRACRIGEGCQMKIDILPLDA